ncbi:hypothetical protein [Aestuariibacter salexigens]|uniref:hypothetical protein n=1 Tax=Aestuariibacter salexigens TaxID=226010 RepID=UPI00040B2A66|nr:hypothetical protein [Aestuariibacter salexigens]
MQVLNKKQLQVEQVKNIIRRHQYDDVDAIFTECSSVNLPVERENLPRFCLKLKEIDEASRVPRGKLNPQKSEHVVSNEMHFNDSLEQASAIVSGEGLEADERSKHLAHRIIRLSDMLSTLQERQSQIVDRISRLSKEMGAFEPRTVKSDKE